MPSRLVMAVRLPAASSAYVKRDSVAVAPVWATSSCRPARSHVWRAVSPSGVATVSRLAAGS
ncbi:MAG TPA: hypothetical protein VFW03_26510 [Gemmatimonadaceae bacterium]|nr:hypothetical protein [Gemmatimonadaceae bacterium]